MKKTLLQIGVVNRNHRTYTIEAVAKALKELDGRDLFGMVGQDNPLEMPEEKIAFKTTELYIEGDKLIADIEILPTPQGTILTELLKTQDMAFVTRGTGSLNEKGEVQNDYSLTGMSAIFKSDSSWEL